MQTSLTRRRSRLARPLSWLVVAGLAGAALIGPGAGGVGATSVVDYATVTGYAEGGPDNNHADTWAKLLGLDCSKTAEDADLGDTYLLSQSWALVIVKAGSEQSAPGHVNTLFKGASAGETVWADSSGDGAFGEGDKGISHIIFCGPQETTTTTTDTTTTRTVTDTDSTTSDTTTQTSTGTESETTSQTTATDTDSTTSDTTSQTSTGTESETTSQTTATDTDSTTSETSTGTESETTSETTATTSTATDTDSTTSETSTGTESESTSTATTDTSPTGEELGATGTPGLTPPATDTVAAASTTGGPDGLRIVLLGFAMVLAVILLLQPKDATKRR